MKILTEKVPYVASVSLDIYNGPAVYAFSSMCTKCDDNGLGWLLYIFLVLFPITLFYIFIIMFNICATHPILMSLIFMSQVFSSIEQSYLELT